MDLSTFVTSGVDWVKTNPDWTLTIAGCVLGAGSAVAKSTKGKTDDRIFDFLMRVFSLVNHRGVPGWKMPGRRAKKSRE